jgi:hypothetical protein
VSEFGYEFSDVATWIWLLPSSYQPQQMGFSLPGETDEAPKMILMRDKSHFLQDPLPLH